MAQQTNWLLEAVEPALWERFAACFKVVRLERGEVLQRPGEEIERVWFPQTAMVGVVSAMPGGDAVQTALIGRDGAVGVFEACGTRQSAFLCETQIAGAAWLMSADDYRRMYDASDELRIAVHKYVEILLTEARQFVACTALHNVDARLCRCILEALERTPDGRTLPATHEILAQMLGVQRTTVTAALSQLQAAGAVQTSRGALTVVRPDLLEQAACCCREVLRMARGEIYASDEPVCDG